MYFIWCCLLVSLFGSFSISVLSKIFSMLCREVLWRLEQSLETFCTPVSLQVIYFSKIFPQAKVSAAPSRTIADKPLKSPFFQSHLEDGRFCTERWSKIMQNKFAITEICCPVLCKCIFLFLPSLQFFIYTRKRYILVGFYFKAKHHCKKSIRIMKYLQ